jgi:hypothetical protein
MDSKYFTFMISTILELILTGCVPYTSLEKQRTAYNAHYGISLVKVERPGKPLERYSAQKVDTSTANSKYEYSFDDDLVKIYWFADSRGISFLLENKTSHSIKIPWDEAAYVDIDGRSHRVMHSGIKYNERENPQPPSIVVRKGFLEDIVFPTDLVYYREGYYGNSYSRPGGWGKNSLLIDSFFMFDEFTEEDATKFKNLANSYVGKSFQVLLPIQIQETVNDYIFAFRVDRVNIKQELRSTF